MTLLAKWLTQSQGSGYEIYVHRSTQLLCDKGQYIYLTNLEPCSPNLQYKASNIIIIVITIRNDKTLTLYTMYISLQLYSVHHKPFLAQKDLFRARGLPCKFRAFEMQSYEAKYPWKHFIAKNSYIPMECCNTTQMPFWVKEKKLLS